MKTPLLAAVLGFAALPGAAQSAPLSYDEAVDGDIASSSPFVPGARDPGPLFALAIGANTIVGRTSYGVALGDQDFDFFRLELPASTVVTSATFSWTSFAANGTLSSAGVGPFVIVGAGTGAGLVDPSEVRFLAEGSGRRSLWNPGALTGPEIYDLAYVIGIGRDQDATGTRWSVDYTWTFVVAPVTASEPATFVLLAVAIAGVAFARRRTERA